MSNQGERFGEINFDITDCLLCGKILSGVGFLHREKSLFTSNICSSICNYLQRVSIGCDVCSICFYVMNVSTLLQKKFNEP